MDVMLQRHCARYIYVVPQGLRELISDISREVLRSQPVHIYAFIADYLDALMITRENARVAARLVQSIADMACSTAELLQNAGMTREDADNVVATIQETFLEYVADKLDPDKRDPPELEEANVILDILAKLDLPTEQLNASARIIQRAWRNFKSRKDKERELLTGMIDWRVAARSAIHFYRKTGVSIEEANRCATLIKAAYKGYYTRRIMNKLATETAEPVEELEDVEQKPEHSKDSITDEEKTVRIDYTTVVPHVDFDEFGNEQPKSSAHAAANEIIQSIFNTAISLKDKGKNQKRPMSFVEFQQEFDEMYGEDEESVNLKTHFASESTEIPDQVEEIPDVETQY